jgi:2-hydroxychromene-2-carboxylate isomerase
MIHSEFKKNIMPHLAKFVSSDFLLNSKRKMVEVKRYIQKKPHQIDVFIAGADPYSYLLVQLLPELVSRFNLKLNIHTIRDLQAEMFPDYPKWQANSLVDADRLARLYHLVSPKQNAVGEVNQDNVQIVTEQLLAAENRTNPLKHINEILGDFWARKLTIEPSNTNTQQQLVDNQHLLKQLGHYLPATVHYGGEWYWGIDRLDHLESRLNSLGLSDQAPTVKYDLQTRHFCSGDESNVDKNMSVEIFYSARSPYSYLGLEQVVKLTQHYDIPLNIKPVLPMMMRNLLVPDTKKMYIFHDTKRLAKQLGIAYGCVADPLGEAVKNCYALYSYAESKGKQIQFLLEFGRAVNSQGIRADRDQGLKIIVERCGLEWLEAKTYLQHSDWLKMVASNLDELHTHGMWGVPCFRHGDTVCWGQDRLWLIEQSIKLSGSEQSQITSDCIIP